MENISRLPERLPDLHRLRWTLKLAVPFHAPRYLGSALRGLLGHGLRKTACVTRLGRCPDCLLVDHCVYTQLFEPASRSAHQHGVPYVLSVPVTSGVSYAKGDALVFEMTLLAPHHHHLPFLIQAYQMAGRRGLGPQKVGFEVTKVESLGTLGGSDWRVVYIDGEIVDASTAAVIHPSEPPQSVVLTWQTPLRIKRRGQLVGPDQFSAARLLESLLYRFFELLDERPPRPLLEQARHAAVEMQADLSWHDWSRYSSRQKTRMRVGGLMGTIELAGKDLPAWWPLLWVGQWLHVGKFTSMGLGRYEL